MTSYSNFKIFMTALSLATTVGFTTDAIALGGLRNLTPKLQDTTPLELIRERVRDHRRAPHLGPRQPHGNGPHSYVGPNKNTPPKGGNVPWTKKHPSKI
jgi:hypothetical protein